MEHFESNSHLDSTSIIFFLYKGYDHVSLRTSDGLTPPINSSVIGINSSINRF